MAGRTCSAPLIPAAIVLELAHASHVAIFLAAALGIVPTAAMMGKATEELAARSGPGIGGLLNVTFGNFPELVIAFFALLEGLQEVVKASIIGSIIGNILLVLGAAMLVGGLGRDKQTIQQDGRARAVRDATARTGGARHAGGVRAGRRAGPAAAGRGGVNYEPEVENLSLAVAVVLMFSYVCGPGLLAEDAPRPVQPGLRGGDGGLERAPRRDRPGRRRSRSSA